MSLQDQHQIAHVFQETEKLLYFVRADQCAYATASRLEELQYGILRSTLDNYVIGLDATISFKVSTAHQFLLQISKWCDEKYSLVSFNVCEKIKNELYDRIAQFANSHASTKPMNLKAENDSSDSRNLEEMIELVRPCPPLKNLSDTSSSVPVKFSYVWQHLASSIKFPTGMIGKDVQEWLLKHCGSNFQSFRNCSICVQYTVPKPGSPEKYFSCSNSSCPFRLKLTSSGTTTTSKTDVLWDVYWNGSQHIHSGSNSDGSVEDTVLSLPKLKQLLRKILNKDSGTSFSEAFSSASEELHLDSVSVGRLKNQAWEHFRYLKRKHSKKGPLSHSQQVLDFVSSLDFYSTIPSNYIARSNYCSQDELLISLGLTTDDREKPFTIPIKQLPDHIAKGMSKSDVAKQMSSIVFVSLSHIWTLYQFVKIQNPSLSVIHIDESLKFVQGTFQALTMGPVIVDTHGNEPGIMSRRFFPLGHLFTSCLKSSAIYSFLESLNDLSKHLFDTELQIYRFVTDYSATLRKGCTQYMKTAKFSICYPHIMGSFSGKHSWMKKFHDESNIGKVKRDVSRLYQCITLEQFTTMIQKLYYCWKTLLNEADFAEFFMRNYGPSSPCKGQWFIGCTGVLFLLPNNNPIENYWGELRGKPFHNIPPIIRTNLALSSFVSTEVPKLLAHDSRNRQLENSHLHHLHKRPMQLVDTVTLALASLLDKINDLGVFDARDGNIDKFDFNKSVHPQMLFFVNRPEKIGSAITQKRIFNYFRSIEGQSTDDESCIISADEFFDNFAGLCCVFLVKNGRIHSDVLPNFKFEMMFKDGLFCTCRSFLVDGRCSAAVLVQDCMGTMVPSMNERMTQVFGIRPNKIQTRRRRYSVSVNKTQYSRIEYQHFGLPRNEEIPTAVHFLFHLSTKQLRILQLIRGFGGRFRDNEPDRIDMLEDIITGTWIGESIRPCQGDVHSVRSTNSSSCQGNESYQKQPNEADTDTDVQPISTNSSSYVFENSTIGKRDENFTIEDYPKIYQYSLSANIVADVIYDHVKPDYCVAYLQDSAQGDSYARIDTTNTCVLLSYLGVLHFLVETDTFQSPQTRQGVTRILLTVAPDFLESNLAQSVRPTPSCFMEPDAVLAALKHWIENRYPDVFENSYTVPFLGTIVARPKSDGEKFIRSILQMHMNQIPIENRVAATCFHCFHQILIIRCHQINFRGKESCNLDFEYHVIDTLPFDASCASGGRCVRYRLQGLEALIRYIQRRVAFTLQAAQQSNLSIQQFKGSEKDEMMLQFFSYLDMRPVDRLVDEHLLGDKIDISLSTIHQRQKTTRHIKNVRTNSFTCLESKDVTDSFHLESPSTRPDFNHAHDGENSKAFVPRDETERNNRVSFCEENQSIGSSSTSLSLINERLVAHEQSIMTSAQKIDGISREWLNEDSCSGRNMDCNSTTSTCDNKDTRIPNKISISRRRLLLQSSSSSTIGRVVKCLSKFWKRVDPRVMFELEPWTQFEGEIESEISEKCLTFSIMNRQKIQNMNTCQDFRSFLRQQICIPFLDSVTKTSTTTLPLYGRSFVRLSSQEWLDDDNIEIFMRMLISFQNELDVIKPSYAQKFHLFFPTWFELVLRLNGINETNNSIDKIVAVMSRAEDSMSNKSLRARENMTIDCCYDRRPKDANITGIKYLGSIFPVNVAGTHWITVVVLNESKTLYLFDLLHPTGRPRLRHSKWKDRLCHFWKNKRKIEKPSIILEFHERLLDLVSEYLNQERVQKGYAKINWGSEIIVNSKLQEDGYNCGVLSCIISWMTVQLRRPPQMKDLQKIRTSADALYSARKWIAFSTLQSSFWKPPLVPRTVRQQIEFLKNEIEPPKRGK